MPHFSKFSISLVFSLLLIVSFGSPSFAFDSKADQVTALKAKLLHLKQNYGMQDFKETHLGVTFGGLESLFTELIQNAMSLEEHFGLVPKKDREMLSVEEFEQLLIGLAATYKDGHTNILRNSRNYYTLGIEASAIGEKLYVTGFDAEIFLPENSQIPISVTDEITHINGVPVQTLARINALYMPAATETSRMGSALKSLINVSHRFLPAKTEGENVTLTFKQHPFRGGKSYTGSYYWINSRELKDLKDDIGVVYPDRPAQGETREEQEAYDQQVLKTSVEEVIKYKAAKIESDSNQTDDDSLPFDILAQEQDRLEGYVYGRSSTTDSYLYKGILNLGFDSSKIFDVGVIVNNFLKENGKDPVTRLRALNIDFNLNDLDESFADQSIKIAYLRLPSYSPNSFDEVVNEVAWIQLAIRQMKSADVMLIDHTHNGGGYNYYGTQFLRQFATLDPEDPKDLKAMWINLRLNDQVLRTSRQWSDGVGFNGEIANFGRDFVNDSLHDAWEKLIGEGNGAAWSGPLPFMNPTVRNSTSLTSVFTPHHKWETFSGPVMMANDKGSASNGDFGAKVLQMNGRGLIYGERSGGLGGPVWGSVDSFPGTYMYMRCTQGECIFPEGVAPIENIGVKPDVQRGIRIEDLLDNFESYARETLLAASLHFAKIPPETIGKAISNIRSTSLPKPQALTDLEEEIIKLNEDLIPDKNIPGSIQSYYAQVAHLVRKAKTEAPGLEIHDFDGIGVIHPALALSSDSSEFNDIMLSDFTESLEIANRLREMLELNKYAHLRSEIQAMVQAYQAMRDYQMLPFETKVLSCESHFGI